MESNLNTLKTAKLLLGNRKKISEFIVRYLVAVSMILFTSSLLIYFELPYMYEVFIYGILPGFFIFYKALNEMVKKRHYFIGSVSYNDQQIEVEKFGKFEIKDISWYVEHRKGRSTPVCFILSLKDGRKLSFEPTPFHRKTLAQYYNFRTHTIDMYQKYHGK